MEVPRKDAQYIEHEMDLIIDIVHIFDFMCVLSFF